MTAEAKWRRSEKRRETLKVVLLGGLVLLLFAILSRNRWPRPAQILPSLFDEPVQTSGGVPASFEVARKGYTYEIMPVFAYELHGLVVSYHDAASFIDIAHEVWKDYINIKDICVIWGRNLETDAFRRMIFRNRDFTCYYGSRDPDAMELFSGSHISNNHLVTTDPRLIRTIKSVRRGDQVRLRGYLANYRHRGAAMGRVTSTSRADTGDNACETIWVDEFTVLKRANPGWRAAANLALLIIVASVVLLFVV